MQVAAFLEINDIAGLVRGANEGQGLGNAFLSHIRAVDGIFHVLSKVWTFLNHGGFTEIPVSFKEPWFLAPYSISLAASL